MEYAYPLDYHWSTDEIIDAVRFYEAVEKAYESGISREELMGIYRRFKEIVPSKAEEKKLCDEFEEMSGYSCYRTMQKAREAAENSVVKM
ncbi:UPF0223 family protein [Ectobacillus ponti]|uniref:UPF0223 protein NK662_17385 n=1 Tax=Ectobacillus ponti TaxID=2961894 RepID=A0AA41XCD2_9BACI|nr:UPF0223 family protein [Ectobacillus ponti]MCP8970298.1 UPF0223 family protein [Ectobacillus ponti]